MTGQLDPEDLARAILEWIRPHIVPIVRAEFERLVELRHRDDRIDYLTTSEYADRFKTTPGATLARIRRGRLHAIRPPGSRQWLIPIDEPSYHGRH